MPKLLTIMFLVAFLVFVSYKWTHPNEGERANQEAAQQDDYGQ